MRTQSWDSLGLERRRAVVVVALIGIVSGSAVLALAYHLFGQVAIPLSIVVGVASGYTVAAAPKRSLELSALVQAREAPTLAASAAIYLQSTRSRSKTILLLRSGESRLSALLGEMKRKTLLGMEAGDDQGAFGANESESVRRILRSVLRANASRLQDEGEEVQSVLASSQSGEETKFPVFMTVSFFLPIMLMLFAGISHHTDPLAIASLTLIEIVILDLVLSFSSTERRKLSS